MQEEALKGGGQRRGSGGAGVGCRRKGGNKGRSRVQGRVQGDEVGIGKGGVQGRLGGVKCREGVQGHRWGARQDTGACGVLGEGVQGSRKALQG